VESAAFVWPTLSHPAMKTLGDPAQDAFQSQFQRKQLNGLQSSFPLFLGCRCARDMKVVNLARRATHQQPLPCPIVGYNRGTRTMMKAPLFSPSSRSTWAPRKRRALSIPRRTLTNAQFHPPPLPHPGVQQGRTDQPSDGKRARHMSGHAHIRLSHAQGSGPRRFRSQFQRTAGCLQDLTPAEGRAAVRGGINGTTRPEEDERASPPGPDPS
jgi:hypothetical protein